jgi:hypothetical protein
MYVVMFKKYLAIICLLFISSPGLSTSSPIDLNKDSFLKANYSVNVFEICDELASFIPEGVQDCQNIASDAIGIGELYALTCKYFDRLKQLEMVLEEFAPEQLRVANQLGEYRLILANAENTRIHTLNMMGLAELFKPEVLTQRDADKPILQQITLSTLMIYNKMLVRYFFMSKGRANVRNFLSDRALNRLCAIYKRDVEPVIGEDGDSGAVRKHLTRGAIMDGWCELFDKEFDKQNYTIFRIFYGMSPTYFYEPAVNKEGFLFPGIEIIRDSDNFTQEVIDKRKEYLAIRALELHYLDLYLRTDELDLLAPLAEGRPRSAVVQELRLAGTIKNAVADQIVSSAAPAIISRGGYLVDRIMLARYTIQQQKLEFQEQVAPMKQEVAELRAKYQVQEKELAQLRAEKHRRELLGESAGDQKSKKKSTKKAGQQMSPDEETILALKKQLKALEKKVARQAAVAESEQLARLQQTLSETQAVLQEKEELLAGMEESHVASLAELKKLKEENAATKSISEGRKTKIKELIGAAKVSDRKMSELETANAALKSKVVQLTGALTEKEGMLKKAQQNLKDCIVVTNAANKEVKDLRKHDEERGRVVEELRLGLLKVEQNWNAAKQAIAFLGDSDMTRVQEVIKASQETAAENAILTDGIKELTAKFFQATEERETAEAENLALTKRVQDLEHALTVTHEAEKLGISVVEASVGLLTENQSLLSWGRELELRVEQHKLQLAKEQEAVTFHYNNATGLYQTNLQLSSEVRMLRQQLAKEKGARIHAEKQLKAVKRPVTPTAEGAGTSSQVSTK